MKKEKVFMKGYKGFNKDLKCRDKQYYENSIAEEDEAIIYNKGIQFCKDPAEVLNYYPLLDDDCNLNEFRKVEVLDECFTDDNKKFVTKKIKIGTKLTFFDLINLSIDFDYKNIIDKCNSENNNDDSAQIGSSGNSAQIGSSGDSAQIGSSGNYAQIGSSGYYAKIGSSGNYAQIGSSGNSAQIGSSGDSAQIGSSGDSAQIGSSGDYAQIGSSGYYAQIDSTGKYSVIMCAGNKSKAKGKIGSWITLAEWEYENEESLWKPKCVKTEYIDGTRIKEDTWYSLKDGKFIEF